MVLAASPDGGKPMLVAFDEPPAARARCVTADAIAAIDRLALSSRRRGVRRRPRRVVARARDGGRRRARSCILAADEPSGARRARRASAALWPAVRFAAGVHPHRAGRVRRASRPSAAAVDAATAAERAGARRDRRDRARLPLRLLAARRPARGVRARRSRWRVELDLPVVIHTREADDDTFAHPARGRGGPRPRRDSLLHAATPTMARARARPRLLHLARRHRDVPEGGRACATSRSVVPADRLLVETDAPFLAPVPHRGKRNEPAWVGRDARARWRRFAASGRAIGAQVARELRRALSARSVTRRQTARRVDTPRETYGLIPAGLYR